MPPRGSALHPGLGRPPGLRPCGAVPPPFLGRPLELGAPGLRPPAARLRRLVRERAIAPRRQLGLALTPASPLPTVAGPIDGPSLLGVGCLSPPALASLSPAAPSCPMNGPSLLGVSWGLSPPAFGLPALPGCAGSCPMLSHRSSASSWKMHPQPKAKPTGFGPAAKGWWRVLRATVPGRPLGAFPAFGLPRFLGCAVHPDVQATGPPGVSWKILPQPKAKPTGFGPAMRVVARTSRHTADEP